MKRYIKFILLLMIGGIWSCTDHFEEMNNPPTSVTEINPDFTFSEAIRDDNITMNYTWIHQRLFGGWAQQWGEEDPGDGLPNYYQPHRRNDNEFWEWNYQVVLKNLERTQALLLDQADGDESNPDIRTKLAMTRIYEVIPFERVTAGVGDAPFSEAVEGINTETTPVYDPQSDIYPALIDQIDNNRDLLNADDLSYGDADYLYQGNVEMWRKFANSLKLRTAMRMSEANAGAAETAVTEAMNAPLISSNEESAMLPTTAGNGPGDNAHPLTREMREPGDKSRIGQHLVEMLKAKNDPRLTLIVEPTPASKQVFEESGDPNDLEYTGVAPNMTDEQYDNMQISEISFPALDVWANEDLNVPVHILTYPEVLFLKAEAALRGWGGNQADAQNFYEAGIRAALTMTPYNIEDQGVIDNYVNAQTPLTGDFENKLEQIIEQKYIALFSRGTEPFFNWRRTGYPQLDPGARTDNVTNGQIPRRAYYHQSEQSLNRENLQEALERQGPDEPLTKMWIDPQ